MMNPIKKIKQSRLYSSLFLALVTLTTPTFAAGDPNAVFTTIQERLKLVTTGITGTVTVLAGLKLAIIWGGFLAKKGDERDKDEAIEKSKAAGIAVAVCGLATVIIPLFEMNIS